MICKVISKDRSYHDVQKNHRSISKDEAMVNIIIIKKDMDKHNSQILNTEN